jgi:enamine deaminase RidA (YjgF/YER057c/UK114 family)
VIDVGVGLGAPGFSNEGLSRSLKPESPQPDALSQTRMDQDGFFTQINPPSLGRPRGFSHGMLAPTGGRLLFVAGQTAADENGYIAERGLTAQFETALRKVLAVIEAAGGRPGHIARMTIYVTDLEAYLAGRRALGDLWSKHMGVHYPAMALVQVTRLVDADAAVEIEATAVLPDAPEA